MPPKKPVVSKPATKGTTATKAPAKGAVGGAAKGGAAKGGAKAAPAKAAEQKTEQKPEVKPIRKILVPEEIGLKEIAKVMGYQGDVGLKLKDSKRWPYIIDRNGNVGTFIKYRDTNYLVAQLPTDFNTERIRMALLGSLRFGKPTVIDLTDCDEPGITSRLKDKMDEIYNGLYDDVVSRSILEDQKYYKLYQSTTDEEVYKNPFDYRLEDFMFMILTKEDPPSTAMEYYFPVIVS